MNGRQQFEALHAPLDKPPEPPPDEREAVDWRDTYDELFDTPALRRKRPSRCDDAERPCLAAYAAAHELAYTRSECAADLIAGLLHGIEEARHGAGGCRRG